MIATVPLTVEALALRIHRFFKLRFDWKGKAVRTRIISLLLHILHILPPYIVFAVWVRVIDFSTEYTKQHWLWNKATVIIRNHLIVFEFLFMSLSTILTWKWWLQYLLVIKVKFFIFIQFFIYLNSFLLTNGMRT